MKKLLGKVVFLLAVSCMAAPGNADTITLYDGGDLSTHTDWFLREATAPGTDGDANRLIDPPDNNGAITSADSLLTGWQLNDQNGGGAFNLPQFQYDFNPTLAAEMATNGFTLTVEFENLGTGGGLWFGFDSASGFGASDQRSNIVPSSFANDALVHTLELTWDPNTSTFSSTIDGAANSISFGGSGDNNYTGPDDGSAMFLFDSGSSAGTSARWNFYSASLTVIPEPGSCVLVGLGLGCLFFRRRR